MTVEQKHPADEIGKALARAGGILTLLSSCYDKQDGSFETGSNFVFESIVTVEAIVETATRALARLYQTCDLTVLREAGEAPVVAEAEPAVATVAPAAPIAPAPAVEDTLPLMATRTVEAPKRYVAPPASSSYLGFFGPTETVSRLAERVDHALPKAASLAPRAQANEIIDRPAETYDELLQKLTAVADQAAFQAHQSPSERTLLPALENLRADLIKLRTVA